MAIDPSSSEAHSEVVLNHAAAKNRRMQQNGITNGCQNGITAESTQASDTNGNAIVSAKSLETIAQADAGSVSSFHTIYRIKDKDNQWTWTDECPQDVPDAAENDETAQYAVVVRNMNCSDSRKKFEAHSIVVQSPWLKKALAEILCEYPGISCDLNRLVFENPFEPFVHRWPEMVEYLERNDLDDNTKEHLTLLVDILQEELRDSIKAYADYLSKGVTTFEHAWMVFQPGALVVSEAHGPLSVMELQESEYTVCRGVKYLQLKCDVIEWNGTEFGRLQQVVSIPEFRGVEKILNLSAYPLAMREDKEALVASLTERGRKFESLAGHHFKSYKGLAITWDREMREVPIYHDGRIVIDCKSFNRYAPCPRRYTKDLKAKDKFDLELKALPHSTNPLNTADTQTEGSNYILSDYLRLLCNNRIRGYSLPMKKWLDFYIPFVTEIKWNTRAFDSLVLPSDQKELILSFTESQVEHRTNFDDIVSGKGQGIIILLSGKPGIGKTLTAESVAEAMQRPLHTISSGDLGQSAWQVEAKLTSILDLVGRWNAVLLLDECDVFLEARATHDLDRNALVSTFLRTLEYYSGILFMTTNRADNIDPAFESRIHVSMQYPDLTATSRKKIWANFLSTQQHALTDTELDELADIDLNGRQIKNILKTSHLLASRKKHALCMADVSTVLDIENRRPEKASKM